jgi:hypothetical protein
MIFACFSGEKYNYFLQPFRFFPVEVFRFNTMQNVSDIFFAALRFAIKFFTSKLINLSNEEFDRKKNKSV